MTEPTVAAAAAGVLVIVGCAAVLTWGLLRAAVLPHPMAIVIALSILTMLSIVGALVADQLSDQFLTLAATGIGAIAGAVTSSFNGKDKNDGQG